MFYLARVHIFKSFEIISAFCILIVKKVAYFNYLYNLQKVHFLKNQIKVTLIIIIIIITTVGKKKTLVEF